MCWILGTILASATLVCWVFHAESEHHARLNAKLKKRLDDLTAEERRDVHDWLAEHNNESHYL